MLFYIKNNIKSACARQSTPDGSILVSCNSGTILLKKHVASLLDMAGQWLDSNILTDGIPSTQQAELLDALTQLKALGLAQIRR